jgi:protein tyrosine phosphatase
MEIPTSGVVNRYIAAQGPLPHTAVDFWQVVWEQLCPTVIMLTAAVERGRVKCHQYWPRLYESQDYGRLQISCLREKETPIGWTREFSLVNQEVSLVLIGALLVAELTFTCHNSTLYTS